jgi:hypothetical protein
MSAIRVVVAVVGVVLAGAPAFGGEYTGWQKDEQRQTYTCEYTYEPKDTAAKVRSKQTVVIYYGDSDRCGWAYYYNAGSIPWARCAVPGNPKYDPKIMYWEALNQDKTGYEPFKDKKGEASPAGFCPTPKDGKTPIPAFPLPPK